MKNNLKIAVSFFLLFLTSQNVIAQWDIHGNPVSPVDKLGSINDEDVNFFTHDTMRMTLTNRGNFGVGISDPRGVQEIMYCPPINKSVNGLIVTLNKCNNSNSNVVLEAGFDNIGGGIADFLGSGSGGETGGGGTSGGSTFSSPITFLTGHTTSLIAPLYAPEGPMFWVRKQTPPGTNPGSSTVDEFDTKFIVMPDGSCGINIAAPRAALDVRGSQLPNRPAAIIGARALGTGTVDQNSGLYQYYTQQVQFIPNLEENGYNQIVKDNDQGMFFTDGLGSEGSNNGGAFVLAPWADGGNASIGGMRMDANGNTEFHGTLRATEVKINAQWWSDFVFDDNYKLRSLSEVEQFIKLNKHLPDVPSEAEVLTEGINIGDMQAIQQQKIEELTLYLIELKNEVEALKAELSAEKALSK